MTCIISLVEIGSKNIWKQATYFFFFVCVILNKILLKEILFNICVM